MDQRKIMELKQRAKSAFGYKARNKNAKKKYHINRPFSVKNSDSPHKLNQLNNNKNDSPRISSKIKSFNYFTTNHTKPTSLSSFNYTTKNKLRSSNYNNEFIPFLPASNHKNIIIINNKLINDLNTQINTLNEKKKSKKINYKQTVNLQKLNDYIIYEYTKNKIEFNKEKNIKSPMNFRMPLVYRRMGNHGKKEDLIPINNQPKINLEDILILHNSNLRTSMTKNKVKSYFFKNSVRYKKPKSMPYFSENNNKYYSDEIALKYINIF
jgi:hypothetical protein